MEIIGVMIAGIFVGDLVLREWRQAAWKRAHRGESQFVRDADQQIS